MSAPNLGRLEQVDVRNVWTSEASDFTPWLATDANLTLLGEAIGLELELEAQEKSVGPFRADILCKDLASGAWVLIENQLERTDHTHLGQLLTYAAGLEAVTIVWVAPRFTDEHRAALDWLNKVTAEGVNFFGLEIELWRIGDSPVAPKFNIVSQPNDWTKTVSEGARRIETGELSQTRQSNLEYWTAFTAFLQQRRPAQRARKPAPDGWLNFSIGNAGFALNTCLSMRNRWVLVDLEMVGRQAKPNFHRLHAQREPIEREVGSPLTWLELPDKQRSRVVLYNREMDPNDRADWPRQQIWLAEHLEAFRGVFAPRIKNLGAGDHQPAPVAYEPEDGEMA